MDLEHFASVHNAASRIKQTFNNRCDLLILNAGIYAPHPNLPPWNPDNGLCRIFTTNHLGNFVMYQQLEDSLVDTGLKLQKRPESEPGPRTARVIAISSDAHRRVSRWNRINDIYDEAVSEPIQAVPMRLLANYSLSKLCNNLFALHLQQRMNERFADPPVVSASINPGIVDTGILDGAVSKWLIKLMHLFGTTPEKAARHIVEVATLDIIDKDPRVIGGVYWEKGKPVAPSILSVKKRYAADLWAWSEQFVDPEFVLDRQRVKDILDIFEWDSESNNEGK